MYLIIYSIGTAGNIILDAETRIDGAELDQVHRKLWADDWHICAGSITLLEISNLSLEQDKESKGCWKSGRYFEILECAYGIKKSEVFLLGV